MEEWGKILSNCQPEELAYGLEHWDREYPPNVYEFRSICKREENAHKHPSHQFVHSSEIIKADPDVVNRELDAMREKLKVGGADERKRNWWEGVEKTGFDKEAIDELMEISRSRCQ